MNGYGTDIPPQKEHVIIYFISNGADESTALTFFKQFKERQWKTVKGKMLQNWKTAAWGLILDNIYNGESNNTAL